MRCILTKNWPYRNKISRYPTDKQALATETRHLYTPTARNGTLTRRPCKITASGYCQRWKKCLPLQCILIEEIGAPATVVRQSKNLNCYVYVRKMAVLSGGWPLLFFRRLSPAASGLAGTHSWGKIRRCERACKAPKRDTAQKWPTRREKSPSFRQKERALFMDRRPFFHQSEANVKTKWLHLRKTCANLRRPAAFCCRGCTPPSHRWPLGCAQAKKMPWFAI